MSALFKVRISLWAQFQGLTGTLPVAKVALSTPDYSRLATPSTSGSGHEDALWKRWADAPLHATDPSACPGEGRPTDPAWRGLCQLVRQVGAQLCLGC